MRTLRAVDLFCGAGGTSQGAEQSGAAKVLCAVNHWHIACETHAANFPHARHIGLNRRQVADKMSEPTKRVNALPALTTSANQERAMADPKGILAQAAPQVNESPRKGWSTFKHGLTHLPEYRAWQTMRLRCLNPKNKAYPDYGGRGIKVCDRWKDDFLGFYADMGPKPTPAHELDRFPNNDGNYEPGNCRWATRSENDRNRRSTVWVEFRGERRMLIELCEEFGIRQDTMRWRLKRGMAVEQALAVPVKFKRPNGVGAAERAERAKRPPFRPRIDSDRQATVVRLFVDGMTYDQIVAATGVSYNTVGRIIKRAGAKRCG